MIPTVLSPGARPTARSRAGLRKSWPYYVAIAPFFVLFAIFGLFPAGYSLVLSFQDWNGLGSPEWVGLDNFRALVADQTFWLSIKNTLIIFALSTFPMMVIAVIVAAMLNSAKRFGTFYRIAFFVPNVTSVVAMAVLFGSIFGDSFGLLNAGLRALGFDGVAWLSTPWAIQVTIAVLITYQWTGYNAILFLAGMQSISGEVYEAAKLDGAGVIRSFWSITLPLLRPTILFVLVVSTITGLQSFTEAQVLTASSSTTNPNSGGAGQAGLTTVLYFYQQAFNYNRFGYGAAIAWAVFLLVVIFVIINWRLGSGKKEKPVDVDPVSPREEVVAR
ncbi:MULTISPECIES: carbohydrate ABC transporter permease [unclassified Frigoribacterium]|uniref:carbohydrate ABC transporter permease n=1 Tax=unclassified Frigoribacterium TaxID=2627005 RepID=UPI0006F5DDD3|nr:MULTISPECIES: sugar ABC transporter permease [unclassified Frigoribacterium]KQM25866.1 cytochrome C biogenesis protein [Frigoribacterium sp. Leaf8]MBD8141336.1 sugar ABC transporter permease [Frigoribacterium sp. CFBP 13605]WAC51380.1 sugar ABC transporter permease [Frigoribacterium sp. SL97]